MDVEAIVKGLSEAQRKTLLESDNGIGWDNENDLIELGLVDWEGDWHGYRMWLTSAGDAVRAYLEKNNGSR